MGAAVGGVVGGVAGTLLDPPPQKVVTYVQQAPAPTERIVVKEKIVVGQPLPKTVVVTPVPDQPKYAYAIVNDERVIVEPSSRRSSRSSSDHGRLQPPFSSNEGTRDAHEDAQCIAFPDL